MEKDCKRIATGTTGPRPVRVQSNAETPLPRPSEHWAHTDAGGTLGRALEPLLAFHAI